MFPSVRSSLGRNRPTFLSNTSSEMYPDGILISQGLKAQPATKPLVPLAVFQRRGYHSLCTKGRLVAFLGPNLDILVTLKNNPRYIGLCVNFHPHTRTLTIVFTFQHGGCQSGLSQRHSTTMSIWHISGLLTYATPSTTTSSIVLPSIEVPPNGTSVCARAFTLPAPRVDVGKLRR